MAMTLCRARYRLGFETISQWVSLTHPVALPEQTLHDAVRPVYLLAQALGIADIAANLDSTRLWLALEERELDAGRVAVAQAMHCARFASAAAAPFGFFAHATGAKAIERSWWLAAIPIEFLPLSGGKRPDTRFPVLHAHSPRQMIAAIAATRMFISPDTGPMHLASATEVPTVALFRNSNVSRYQPMKSSDSCIDVTTCAPRAAAQLCQRRWREGPG
jgi:heptosyltransferase III